MAEAESKKFCRESLACRREAAKAASPEHKDAWLKLADDWSKLAVEWRKFEAVDELLRGEPLKRYRLSYWGRFLGSFETATEAVKHYDQHDELIRPVTDPKRKGRYTIRDGDGRDEEITVGNLRTAAKKEQTAATANQDPDQG
jgi:hypothetical protein